MSKRLMRVLSLIMVLCMFLSVGTPALALGPDVQTKTLDGELNDENETGAIEPLDPSHDKSTAVPTMQFSVEDEERGYSVLVEAPLGALPTGTELRVEPRTVESVREAVEEAVERPVILAALEISFWLDEEKIDPAEPVQVFVTAPGLAGVEELTLVQIREDEEPAILEFIPEEDLPFQLNEDEIAFETAFSAEFAVLTVAAPEEPVANEDPEEPGYGDPDLPPDDWDHDIDPGEVRPIGDDIEVPMVKYEVTDPELGYTVTVEALESALPAGTELRVEPVEIEDVREAVEEVTGPDRDILLALDISFWLDVEVEPTEPVQVVISAPELEGRDDLQIIHLPDEDDPETIDLIPQEDLAFTLGPNEIAFRADSFSTYVVSGQTNSNITIHYVYVDGDTFTELGNSSNSVFPSGTVSAQTFYNNWPYYGDPYKFLKYDFAGYTYKETRLNYPGSNGTQIRPILRVEDTAWVGTRYNWRYTTNGNDWSTLSSNSNVYVIYEKKTVTSGGSSGGSGGSGSVDVPDLPAGKSVEPNGDGTYDITLSVTGVEATQETVTKANVIIVFDVSGSMNDDMNGNSTNNNSLRRMTIAKEAVNSLAATLLSEDLQDANHNQLVQMALIQFSTTASYVLQDFTDDLDTFTDAVNGLEAEGGTNWEHALILANSMEVDPNANTYVVFVSDGDPTFRYSRLNLTDSELYSSNYNYVGFDYGITFGRGNAFDEYNLTAAKAEAKAIVDAGKSFYTIGLSDDEDLEAHMQDLTTSAGSPAENYFSANDSDDLNAAFATIASDVTSHIGFTEVKINDGVTELTTVESDALTGTPTNFVYRRGTHTGDEIPQNDVWAGAPEATITADNHVIWDTSTIGALEPGVTYSVTFTVWPSQESYDIIADINNGIIRDAQGNIIRTGTPTEAYNAQPQEIRNQIIIGADGKYTLKTNTGVTVSYKFNGADGEEAATVTKEGSMPLDTTYFRMTKDWLNVLPQDSRTASVLTKTDEDGKSYLVDSNGAWILDDEGNKIEPNWSNMSDKAVYYVDLIVTKAGEDYVEVRLTSEDERTGPDDTVHNGPWEWNQMFVAPGVMTHDKNATSGALEVREHGDDYTVREKPSESYYWELFAETYHPMVINGEACVLQLVDEGFPEGLDAESALNTFSGDYYNINGKVYHKLGTASDAVISAINERRSYLNLTKVVDEASKENDGYDPDAYFTYTVKMENPNGLHVGDADYDKAPDGSDDPGKDGIWFSVYDPVADSTVMDENIVTGANREMKNGQPTGYWYFDNVEGGATVTIKIKEGWNVRFINLLSETTYEFEETMDEGFALKTIEATAVKNGSPLTYEEGKEPVITGAKISGTIVEPNTDYTITYTNKFSGFFYVYHSADNTVQRFPVAVNGFDRESFDINALTATGTLYGGYYTDYAGKSDGFDFKDLTFDADNKADDEGGTPYTYAYIKENSSAWTLSNAYSVIGTAMHPVADTVYFLKEVPSGYLMPYTHYTYYKADDKKLGTVWTISAVDDLNYSRAGFYIETTDKDAVILESMLIRPENGTVSVTLTAEKVFKSKGVQKGYLGYVDITDYKTGSPIVIRQFWTTIDGIEVFGLKMRTLDFGDGTINATTGIRKTDSDFEPLPTNP